MTKNYLGILTYSKISKIKIKSVFMEELFIVDTNPRIVIALQYFNLLCNNSACLGRDHAGDSRDNICRKYIVFLGFDLIKIFPNSERKQF